MAAFTNPLLEFFVSELNSESMLIRSSALYAVSQFAQWISKNLSDEVFAQYMGILAGRLQETDWHIRETACQSLQETFKATDPDKLAYVAKDILVTIASVMQTYKGMSFVSLLDTIATLAEVLYDKMRSQEIAAIVLPLMN